MRCPQCNKFAAFEEGDTTFDTDSSNLEELIVGCAVTVSDGCAECGTELRSGTIELEHQIEDDEFTDPVVAAACGADPKLAADWTVEFEDPERADSTRPVKRNGHTRKVAVVGVDVNWTVVDAAGAVIASGTLSDGIEAADMEEVA